MTDVVAWTCRFGMALLLCAGAGSVMAVEPYQEYRKLIESAQNLTVLKDDLFGESVSLYNGKTEFNVTDVSLPGNNVLPVEMRRRFSVEMDLVGSGSYNSNIDGVGGWEVDTPHISGMFPGLASWPDNRCSGHMAPQGPVTFRLNEIWQGNMIHVPDGGDRTMLGAWANSPMPADGVSRKWSTSYRDAIDCIPMKSGLAGEGYRVKTSSGVSYFFDTAFTRYGGTLEKSGGLGDRTKVARMRIYLMASRVEDRSGNWVQYQYNNDGHPVRIWSSDGREITLAYNGGLLTSTSVAGRIWTYTYGQVEGQNRLTSVTQPDGSTWAYSYSSALRAWEKVLWDGNGNATCREQPPARAGTLVMSIKHPSGAMGEFQFSNGRQYRSGVHASECIRRIAGSQYYYELVVPFFYDVVSLRTKTTWGPGLPKPLAWTYSYGDGFESLWGGSGGAAIYPCATCKKEKQVTVSNPDATRTVYRYGSQYALNEGRLLGSSVLNASGEVVRSSSTLYMTEDEVKAQPFIPYYGMIYSGDEPSTAQVRPVVAEAIEQDGVTYQTSMLSFDDLARPLRVNGSSPMGSRTDATQYADDRTKWILGATAMVTNENTGVIVGQSRFDGLMRPTEVRSFGRLDQVLSYNSDGTIASVADGRGNTSVLSGWKRGSPQQIALPDGTVRSASVDDNGWIRSVTDANGATTEYGYDAMGRIASIDLPAGDSVAWTRTTQSFTPVDGVEHGVEAGHWRQTVVTGNARRNVYFDVLWRPLLTEDYDEAARASTQRFQRFAYDESGRQVFASHPGTGSDLSAGTWTTYDALGRQTSVSIDSEKGILTSLTAYLEGGAVKSVDARGNATTSEFQTFGEPSIGAPVSILHPEGVVTEISRDIFGKPLSIARRNFDSSMRIARHYVYDGNQRLCKSAEPETGTTLMGYDAAGNVVWSASGLDLPGAECDFGDGSIAARKVVRGYDSRNRLSTLSFPDRNGDQAWTYTKDGMPSTITTVNDAGASLAINTFTYNKRGLLTAETSSDSTLSIQSLGYAYDALGSLAGLTYPSGRYVDYAPNALGQPTRAGAFAVGVSYYPNGGMRQFTYGNGIVHTMVQNERQLPSQVADSSGVLDNSYEYDVSGNVVRIADNLDGARTRAMAYDHLDRLVQATSPAFGGDGTFRYTYDVVDNLRSAALAGGKDHVYWYDSRNRLTNVQNSGGATTLGLVYDVQGNLSARNGVGYSFDFGNRLRAVAGAERYRYDARGRRILSTENDGNAAIRSLYGNDGVLRRQENARQGKNVEYIYLNGSLVAQATSVVAPTLPVLIVPPFSNNGSFQAQWTLVSNASRYELREQAGAGAWAVVYNGAALAWSSTAKVEGTYGYSVRACQLDACSAWTAAATVVVQLPPRGRAGISIPATTYNGIYSLSWSAVPGTSTYRLQEQAAGGTWQTIQEAAALTLAVSGRVAGTYAYRVYACNPAGCGPQSQEVSTKVIFPPITEPSINAPSQSLTGGYTVSWSAVAGATRYSLEESVNNAAWTVVASIGSTGQMFSDKTTGNYAYRVRGGNDAGWGAYSVAGTVSVIRPPGVPTISAPAGTASGSAMVTWNGVAMAATYLLDESINGGVWIAVQNDGSTQSLRSGLMFGTYSYRVRACNAAGCGGFSNTAGVSSNPPPGTPQILRSVKSQWKEGRATKIACSVNWTSVPGATTYELMAYGGRLQYSGPDSSIKVDGAAYCAEVQVVRACNISGCSAWSSPPFAQRLVDYGDRTNPK